jgi:hypothetical protein
MAEVGGVRANALSGNEPAVSLASIAIGQAWCQRLLTLSAASADVAAAALAMVAQACRLKGSNSCKSHGNLAEPKPYPITLRDLRDDLRVIGAAMQPVHGT